MRTLASLLALSIAAGACADAPTEPQPIIETAIALGSWDEKVTGGSSLYVGSCTTLLFASVSATDQDGVRGQFQIKAVEGTGAVPNCTPTDPEVLLYQFHGEVDQLAAVEGSGQRTASVCGVISAAQGDGSSESAAFAPGSFFRVDILDHDVSADRLRHRVQTAAFDCAVSNATFPAVRYEGGFNIRIR